MWTKALLRFCQHETLVKRVRGERQVSKSGFEATTAMVELAVVERLVRQPGL